MDWYFDLRCEFDEEDPGVVWVERVYRFDWEAFSAADWRRLAEIHPQLPGWIGEVANRGYCWFNSQGDEPPYVTAVTETVGLQVNAALPDRDWRTWDATFRRLAAALPKREVD